MRRDSVPGTDIYEFHVYKDTADFRKALSARQPLDAFEEAVVAPDGTFIAKHGKTAAVPNLPEQVHNSIRGVVTRDARRATWLGERGTENIRGRNLTKLIREGMTRTGSFRYLATLGKTLGYVGPLVTVFNPSVQQACELDPTFEAC